MKNVAKNMSQKQPKKLESCKYHLFLLNTVK